MNKLSKMVGVDACAVCGDCNFKCKHLEAALARLTAYEDTGLTPDEITVLLAQQEAGQNKPLTYNNLLGMVGHSVYCVEHKAFVKICKDHVGMYLVNQDGKCSSYHDNLTFYLCPPVAAKKNENGCKYCCDGDVIALDSCSAVRIERDGQNYIMGGCDWEHEINYCPMCGRQLRHPPKAERKS